MKDWRLPMIKFKWIFPLIVILLLTSCSYQDSEETFRGSIWGDTEESVIKQEKKLGNDAYERIDRSSGDLKNIGISYKNIVLADQKVEELMHGFSNDFNGEKHGEPVLEQIFYMFEESSLDKDKVIEVMNKKYGEAEILDDDYRLWSVGDTVIFFTGNVLVYEPKSRYYREGNIPESDDEKYDGIDTGV